MSPQQIELLVTYFDFRDIRISGRVIRAGPIIKPIFCLPHISQEPLRDIENWARLRNQPTSMRTLGQLAM